MPAVPSVPVPVAGRGPSVWTPTRLHRLNQRGRLEVVKADKDIYEPTIRENEVIVDRIELPIEGHLPPALATYGHRLGLKPLRPTTKLMPPAHVVGSPFEPGKCLGLRRQWLRSQSEGWDFGHPDLSELRAQINRIPGVARK